MAANAFGGTRDETPEDACNSIPAQVQYSPWCAGMGLVGGNSFMEAYFHFCNVTTWHHANINSMFGVAKYRVGSPIQRDAFSRMATGELDEFASPPPAPPARRRARRPCPGTRSPSLASPTRTASWRRWAMQKEERRQMREMEEAMRIEKARASKAKAVEERARFTRT